MKWLIGCLLALVMVSAAFAGEDPYISIVGDDIDFNSFYFSQKQQQFLFDQADFSVPICFGSIPPKTPQTRVGDVGCEQFRSNKPINQPEICDVNGVVHDFLKGDFDFFGEPNAVITKQNAGYFEWWIRLIKKPSGEINICIQCGVLKPNTFTPFTGFLAVEECAAETGERVGTGFCTRDQVEPGRNPINNYALPKLTAIAYPGPFANTDIDGNTWAPFNLTAYKNPSNYRLTTITVPEVGLQTDFVEESAMTNSDSLQLLDGSPNARILLKSCMDKCVVAKIPVTGQINAAAQPGGPDALQPVTLLTEQDLEAGDLIQIRLDIPIQNTVDIYCHAQSASLRGIGESPF